jgi:hypothetical protein
MELLTAGLAALKGLSLLTDLIREPREASGRRGTGSPLTEAEFERLLGRLLAADRKASASGVRSGADANADESLTARRESERVLGPLLFRTLDADGNGLLEGQELRGLRRLVSHLDGAVPPGRRAEFLRAFSQRAR